MQTFPKLFVNQQKIPTLENNESFKYLGRYFNYAMDNHEHKRYLLSETDNTLNKIDKLPLLITSKVQIRPLRKISSTTDIMAPYNCRY